MSKSIRLWAIGRRIQYAVGFLSFWGMIGVLIYFVNYYQPPSCFDLVMNADETGIDCGGGCVRICAAEVLQPKLIWADSFEVTPGQYNAVAYIENENQIAATPELRYTFQFLNEGQLVAEKSGQTMLPPNSVYPIFEGRIFTDNREVVTETKLIIEPVEMWIPASVGRDQFRSRDINLSGADARPRLDVKIENTLLVPANDVEVVATIFNEKGEPVTASQTYIEKIEARSTKDIVFTWPQSIARTVRNCIVPTDVVLAIDLSGSMNNDSDNPPQPLTDALNAASDFVHGLKDDDQVSVVTFATNASVSTELTNLHGAVANSITGLTIDETEEAGFTNTVEALKIAAKELGSERHNGNARRVLVLLTDGLPTAPGEEDVVAEAIVESLNLQDDNIEIYAIGLGEGSDKNFISGMASDETNAYFAPTGADLASIYSEITSSLCESGLTKIDVLAKTKTNFAPLR